MTRQKTPRLVRRRQPLYVHVISVALCSVVALLFTAGAEGAEELALKPLIEEALKNSPEIQAAEARTSAAQYRIPQAKSLPDPMLMFGYQNEGWERYTYGEMADAQWMYSVSQMFPFPGKRGLKGDMAARDAESRSAAANAVRLKTVARVKELYYDLALAYKNLDLLKEREGLFSKIEDAALARYSAGMAPQQEVLMAQTEKYMLLEKEEMQKQKIQSLEAMLNTTAGRAATSPLGRPAEPSFTSFGRSLNEMIAVAQANSPEVRAREKMIAAAEAKVKMAKKEYYPDFTVAASVFQRGGEFDDMWSLTTTVNIPLYYKTKQRQGVHEAEAEKAEARNELEAAKLMLASGIRDTYAMLTASERLMDVYKSGLIPKTYQDFESALSGYGTGRTEAITVINRLKAIVDFENSYWAQLVEHEKAIARLESLAGIMDSGKGEARHE